MEESGSLTSDNITNLQLAKQTNKQTNKQTKTIVLAQKQKYRKYSSMEKD